MGTLPAEKSNLPVTETANEGPIRMPRVMRTSVRGNCFLHPPFHNFLKAPGFIGL